MKPSKALQEAMDKTCEQLASLVEDIIDDTKIEDYKAAEKKTKILEQLVKILK